MSLRPRFGDGGSLRQVRALRVIRGGEWYEVAGSFSDHGDFDPFERTDRGLLLAEDFARTLFADEGDAKGWFDRYGVLDIRTAMPDEDWGPPPSPLPEGEWFHDPRVAVERFRVLVAWTLRTLARLSDEETRWRADWLEVIIDAGSRLLWLEVDGDTYRYRLRNPEPEPPEHRTLWVPSEQWELGWLPIAEGRPWAAGDGAVVPLTPDHDGLIELIRRLLEPYVRMAAPFELDMFWLRPDLPLVVRERRRWRSVMAPIALQLLEGLRRVTEGQTGAAFCRECGEPFLALDARRSSFCNDQHRFRFSQRERRKRLDAERAVKDAIAIRDGTARDDRRTRRGKPL